MSGTVTQVNDIGLSGTKHGKITISTVTQPYGPKSESVASIGISLKAKSTEPEWKVHIPKGNIDAVIAALAKAKEII